jgi:glycosyltransferase involved in cell wall biosynthesis
VNAIVTAFPRMAARVPIAELVIVGEGSKRDILQKQASASGLDKRIRFLGSVPYGEMAGLYKAADVFVSIPASDATAMSLLEAMSCGLPVIVSDLPANREWISEGLNGSLVDPADLERMSQCMEEPFRNSALRTTYGSVNVAAIQEKANHDREMERMMEFYRSLVPRKKRH